jgi:hypothetical protein
MILNRRDFLQTTLGVAAAAYGVGCRALAANPALRTDPIALPAGELGCDPVLLPYLDCLGRPPSWDIVRQGFWPIAPERVLVLRPHPWAGPQNRWQPRYDLSHRHLWREVQMRKPPLTFGEAIRIRNGEKLDEAEQRSKERDWHARWPQHPDHKLGLVARITAALTAHYNVPQVQNEWAVRMATRERIGSTGWKHWAMPHEFQNDSLGGMTIRTANEGIDWWLILIPGGTQDWNVLDDLPLYAMITHIHCRPYGERPPGLVLRAYCLTEAITTYKLNRQSPNSAIELSEMDRATAAQCVNAEVMPLLRCWERNL